MQVGHNVNSPSLAEGARGWVDSTSASQTKSATANDKNATASNANISIANKANANTSVIASERSERGKTRRSRSFFSNPQETLAQRIDCHANASAFARNDEKSAHNDERLTHPQTPSAREGAFKITNSAVCHTEGVARSISKDSADNAKSFGYFGFLRNLNMTKLQNHTNTHINPPILYYVLLFFIAFPYHFFSLPTISTPTFLTNFSHFPPFLPTFLSFFFFFFSFF
ncbi:hypothetical protein [Helicobacter sp. MIT 01-3238]|uniref:hypothetical protein n=1 Tax=Helicobacter sp. MIT 01-3238 TaxID=398627 RepID=UPI000E1E7694|nr:hypothetical protein [Helicobacter sp. MIT 01-3238]RDU51456.1 hypothetical protein CQA40_10115 [Helicobacter sp. MIT 01-3238]